MKGEVKQRDERGGETKRWWGKEKKMREEGKDERGQRRKKGEEGRWNGEWQRARGKREEGDWEQGNGEEEGEERRRKQTG